MQLPEFEFGGRGMQSGGQSVGAIEQQFSLLRPWHKVVSGRREYFRIDHRSYIGRFIGAAEAKNSSLQISGFYAKYCEGLFYLFKDGNDDVYLGILKNGLRWDDITRIEWKSDFKGRTVRIYGRDGQEILSFEFHTIKRRIFCDPWNLFMDFLAPDDDWGLVADLPSFIHSVFRMRRNIKKSLSSLLSKEGNV